jgi:hypothetical protein
MADVIPREGTPDTFFERLRDYMGAVDLTWAGRIRGVDGARAIAPKVKRFRSDARLV